MDKRTQGNIGESNKTSIKVHHQPGGNSNWSLGWEDQSPKQPIKKYHNQSNVVFGGDNEALDEEEKKKREEERKKKEQELNSKLPDFDPKMGNKTSVKFGESNDTHTSVKVRAPPGGRSNFTLG